MNTTVVAHEYTAHGRRGYVQFLETDRELSVSMLRVTEKYRMLGIGGRLIGRVCAYADQVNKPVYLYAVALGHGTTTLPLSLLIAFYKRRGFVEREDADYCKLVRYPVASAK